MSSEELNLFGTELSGPRSMVASTVKLLTLVIYHIPNHGVRALSLRLCNVNVIQNPGAPDVPLDNGNGLYSVPYAQFKSINRARCLSVECYQLSNGVFSCVSVLSIQISGAFRGWFYLKRSLKWMQSEICRRS